MNNGSGFKTWFVAAVLAAFAAGCGDGDGIFGGPPGGPGGASALVVVPGAGTCLAAVGFPLIPRVNSSVPTSGAVNVTTSTTGVAPNKLITATFSIAMNPATINSATAPLTFTLTDTAGPVAGTVTMNGAGTIATFTTTAGDLSPGTLHTATITTAAMSAGAPNTALACTYVWTFTTGGVSTGLAPINLGLATPFAIASAANLTNTSTAPITHINGDVVLFPTSTCNADVMLFSDGPDFGTCTSGAATAPPTHNAGDLVITGAFPDAGVTADLVRDDLQAAYVSLSTPASAPAGPLGPGTTILAPTTLGTGSTGQNTFTPGLYTDLAAGTQIQGDLTLDALGDPDAMFVFQIPAGSLTTIAGTRILLTGSAKASNVWWQVGSSASLGTGTEWHGNILADTSITMLLGTTSCGRLLAGAFTVSGAFVFDSNIVAVPGNPFVPGGTRSPICQ